MLCKFQGINQMLLVMFEVASFIASGFSRLVNSHETFGGLLPLNYCTVNSISFTVDNNYYQ